jgi:asparagine synthase (glutamine-hydrolysing)
MCGLTGFLGTEVINNAADTLIKMATSIQHRGPDDQDIWLDDNVGLAHRRLSILDLSPDGRQPMLSHSGRYVIVYNGEVYNFKELSSQLSGIAWRGHSDTEVILAAIETWGLEAALERFIGMFAFALWDRQTRTLHLVRDRLGIKPLYYGWSGKTFLFGSELKALRAWSSFEGKINRDALALFLKHNYVPTPYSIYENIYKLPQGHVLSISVDTKPNHLPEPKAYWSAKHVIETANTFSGSSQEAIEQLEFLLKDAIKLRMVADVPLGAFLSGGIDSSTVVALMQSLSSQPVNTFSIGFQEDIYNEAKYAKAVAEHLNTNHTELYVSGKEAMEVIPELPRLYDEPFAAYSQIPLYLISKIARQQVTVALSGDGGDELFAGYTRYIWASKIWKKMNSVPLSLRKILANILQSVPPHLWDSIFKQLAPVLPSKFQQTLPSDKLYKLANILSLNTADEVYQHLVSDWKQTIVIGADIVPYALNDKNIIDAFPNFTERMMYLDLMTYLPDEVLAKVDRATMGTSLEARVPLLDHRVVEFAWQLPLSLKLHDGQGKYPLRQILYKYVPKELIERPKMGFGVPIGEWLRGSMRDWAGDMLSSERLKREGFLNNAAIQEKWLEHSSGKRNWQNHLWNVLMFETWLETNEL